jgi:hypothetical protein
MSRSQTSPMVGNADNTCPSRPSAISPTMAMVAERGRSPLPEPTRRLRRTHKLPTRAPRSRRRAIVDAIHRVQPATAYGIRGGVDHCQPVSGAALSTASPRLSCAGRGPWRPAIHGQTGSAAWRWSALLIQLPAGIARKSVRVWAMLKSVRTLTPADCSEAVVNAPANGSVQVSGPALRAGSATSPAHSPLSLPAWSMRTGQPARESVTSPLLRVAGPPRPCLPDRQLPTRRLPCPNQLDARPPDPIHVSGSWAQQRRREPCPGSEFARAR